VLAGVAASARWRPAVITRVDRIASRARDRREKSMVKRIAAPAIEALLTQLRAVLAATSPASRRRAAGAIVIARLRRRAAAFVRALDAAGTLYAVEPLHRVRIAAKKLRYTLELARPAVGLAAGREIRIIRQVQVRLGEIHDVQVLQDRVQAAASEASPDRATSRQLADLDRRRARKARMTAAPPLPVAAGGPR
jgi:CHAD domain-containing protein